MMKLRSVLVIGITSAALSAVAHAQAVTASVRAAIERYEKARESSRVDRAQVILEWYNKNPTARPVVVVADQGGPGRGRGRGRGGGNMPPGWEKKLSKHGTLSSDLHAAVVVVPVALVRTLPALPRGQEYAIVGNRVVVVERSSWLILDILVTL